MGASGRRIYCYKLTTDSGGAPCVDGGQLLSLAICKPMIRQTCSQGSYIIGFGGKGLRERLLYVAKITGIAENYYRSRKYAGRGDQIYRWDGTRPT